MYTNILFTYEWKEQYSVVEIKNHILCYKLPIIKIIEKRFIRITDFSNDLIAKFPATNAGRNLAMDFVEKFKD